MVLSREGWVEILRRVALELSLVVAAVAGIGYGAWIRAGLAAAVGVVIYVTLPRPHPPARAWYVERMPSVYMPDLLAALLVTTFLALPFIIAAWDSALGSPWGPLLMTGLPAVISAVIFWIAASYQCRWILLSRDRLTVATIRGTVETPLPEIVQVRGEVRRPPVWLAPLLVLFGGLRGAGIAMLHGHTPRHILVVERNAGPPVRLPVDSFPHLPKLLQGFDRAGVALGPELTDVAP